MWIFGLTIALATFSYASWQAWSAHEPLRRTFDNPRLRSALSFAGFFFCLGMADASRAIWQVVIWLGLAVLFIWQVFLSARK